MNLKRLLIINLLVFSLVLTPVYFSFGQVSSIEPSPENPKSEGAGQLALGSEKESTTKKTETIVEQIQKTLERLFSAGEEPNLTDQEQELKEIEVGKQVLKEIIDLSIKENQELLEKVKNLVTSENYQKVITEDLQAVELWYLEVSEKITGVQSQDEIKELAKNIKNFRQATYEASIQRALSAILVSQETKIIELAKKRSERIRADLKKLGGLGFNTAKLDKILSQAVESIELGNLLNKKASDLLTALFAQAPSSTAETSSTFEEIPSLLLATTSIKNQTSTNSEMETTPEIIGSTSTIISSSSATSSEITAQQEKIREETIENLKNSVTESNSKIKAAYTLFLKMADLISQGLIKTH